MEQKWTRASLEQLKLEIIKTNNELHIYLKQEIRKKYFIKNCLQVMHPRVCVIMYEKWKMWKMCKKTLLCLEGLYNPV